MTTHSTAIDDLLRIEAHGDARILALAAKLSVASRIEPALVRAVRLALLPDGDAGVEADVWFSALMETRDPSAAAMLPDVAAVLRGTLAEEATREELLTLGEILDVIHAGAAPALRSEERVAILSLRPSPADERLIEEELHSFRRALSGEQGGSLADWLSEAVARFPRRARLTRAAAALGRALGPRTRELLLQIPAGDSSPTDVAIATSVPVGVRASGSGLEISAPPVAGSLEVPLPPTRPLVLDVSWPTDEGWETERVEVENGQVRTARVPLGVPWRLSNLAGDELSIRAHFGRRRPLLRAVANATPPGFADVIERQTANLLWEVRWASSGRNEPAHATLVAGDTEQAVMDAFGAVLPRDRGYLLVALRGWVGEVDAEVAVAAARVRELAGTFASRLHEGDFSSGLRAALLVREQVLTRSWMDRRTAPVQLGPRVHADGTTFAVFSESAERVELCLFSARGEETRLEMARDADNVWVAHATGAREGQRYGYRAHGPWAPAEGQWFNPAKLLMDPYARAIEGPVEWTNAAYGHRPPGGNERNDDDSAPFVPRSVVADTRFEWEDDAPPRIPWRDTIIYETHVKGFTFRHSDVPRELRGTYAGLAHPAAISHLQQLGVTAIQLLPVHQFIHGRYLVERKLRNYWGYASIGYFAPHDEYASNPGDQLLEFKRLVKAMHAAGMEVILDVVYNHTAEGNHLGPTLSFRGLENAAYYRLTDDRRHYLDFTGMGNAVNTHHSRTLDLVLDSLRYWVTEMHVDGFRFDLAVTLARAREMHEVDRYSSFLTALQQDPVLGGVKLIAEPWDLGDRGYQLGNFPAQWSEWNGQYRDAMRAFWLQGGDGSVADFKLRFTGSPDLYQSTGRHPFASINYITSHDGFTLHDLVSYNEKHNEANGEENRDGESHNRSWNCGVEGPTDDPGVRALRRRMQRNLLATMMLSQGVPMLLGGDELGRTQHGNNNGYCQDNEVTWYDWAAADNELLAFVRRLIALRREHPVFRRQGWLRGRRDGGMDSPDIVWFTPAGEEMADGSGDARSMNGVGVFLNGAASQPGDMGDDSFYLMFNPGFTPVAFSLPSLPRSAAWTQVLDTSTGFIDDAPVVRSADALMVAPNSLVVLRSTSARSSNRQ